MSSKNETTTLDELSKDYKKAINEYNSALCKTNYCDPELLESVCDEIQAARLKVNAAYRRLKAEYYK